MKKITVTLERFHKGNLQFKIKTSTIGKDDYICLSPQLSYDLMKDVKFKLTFWQRWKLNKYISKKQKISLFKRIQIKIIRRNKDVYTISINPDSKHSNDAQIRINDIASVLKNKPFLTSSHNLATLYVLVTGNFKKGTSEMREGIVFVCKKLGIAR